MKIDKDLVSVAGSLTGRDLSRQEAERVTLGANFHELESLLAGRDTPVPSPAAVANLKPMNDDEEYNFWTGW